MEKNNKEIELWLKKIQEEVFILTLKKLQRPSQFFRSQY